MKNYSISLFRHQQNQQESYEDKASIPPPPLNLTNIQQHSPLIPPSRKSSSRWILNVERRCQARAYKRIRSHRKTHQRNPLKQQVKASGLTPPSKITRVISHIGGNTKYSQENVLERLFADVASLARPEHSIIMNSLLYLREEIKTLMTSSTSEKTSSPKLQTTYKLTMMIENITNSNHFDLETVSEARGFLMYTTNGLVVLPKVIRVLTTSISESRTEVLFEMLHSALTWSKSCSPLASSLSSRTPPSSPISSAPSSPDIWSPELELYPREQKTESSSISPSKEREDEEEVDTKRCTTTENTTMMEDTSASHHPHTAKTTKTTTTNSNLNTPIVSMVVSLCKGLCHILSTKSVFPEDVARALVVSILAVTLVRDDEHEVEGDTFLNEEEYRVQHDRVSKVMSELLETSRVLLLWQNASEMDAKQRLQFRRTLCAIGLACGGVISREFSSTTITSFTSEEIIADNMLRSPLLPPMKVSSKHDALEVPSPLTKRTTSRITFVQRFVAGKSSLENWLSRYVREKKISRRWGGSSAMVLCRSVAVTLMVSSCISFLCYFVLFPQRTSHIFHRSV